MKLDMRLVGLYLRSFFKNRALKAETIITIILFCLGIATIFITLFYGPDKFRKIGLIPWGGWKIK
jgi:hypothetical protein